MLLTGWNGWSWHPKVHLVAERVGPEEGARAGVRLSASDIAGIQEKARAQAVDATNKVKMKKYSRLSM